MPMKLLKIEIEGFRSLRHVVWEPGDLNILIGPNAGGKSNLLKALEFISVAAGGNLGDYVEQEGGAAALAWDGTVQTVTFMIKMELDIPSTATGFYYTLRLARFDQASAFEIDDEALWRPLDGARYPNRRLFHRTRDGISTSHGDIEKSRPTVTAALRDNDRTLLSHFNTAIAEDPSYTACGDYLSGWRSYQDFHTESKAKVRRSAVPRKARKIDPDGQNLVNVLNTLYSEGGRFKEDVDDAMNAAFPGQYEQIEFPQDTADQRRNLAVRWKNLSSPTLSADLSDGTLRFLFLLAVLANPSPPPLIAIDEPEAGLHPSMLPIVAETASTAAEKTQIILTTHSSEFLDAFSETSVKPAIHIVESHLGETQIRPIAGERLAHWLHEYKLGDLYRTKQLEAMQ